MAPYASVLVVESLTRSMTCRYSGANGERVSTRHFERDQNVCNRAKVAAFPLAPGRDS